MTLLGSVSALPFAAEAADAPVVQTVPVQRAELAPLPGAPVAPAQSAPPQTGETYSATHARYDYEVPNDIDWRIAPRGLFTRARLARDTMSGAPQKKTTKAWKPKKKTDLADVQHGLLRLNVTGIKAGTQNLSEAAHLQLAMQKMSMDAKFSAEAGHKSNDSSPGIIGPSDLWQSDVAQIAMQVNPVPMAQVAITGAAVLTQTYRQPAQIGETGSAPHMLQTEKRSGRMEATLTPLSQLRVIAGMSGDSYMTKDTSAQDRADKNSNLIETQNEEAFVNAIWTPVQGVEISGGTTTRNSRISWQATHSKSGSYQSAEPHVGVKLQLFDGTQVSGRLAYSTSGYNPDNFVSYARTATTSETVPVVPDHAWTIETEVQRQVGPAKVALNYKESYDGTVTEFGFSGSGVQAPVSTTLDERHEYGFHVTMPLTTLGVPHTTVSGVGVMRDSRVLDPVTGVYRRASGEVPAALTLKLEHRLPVDRLRIGLTDDLRAGQTAYQIQEVSEIAPSNKVGAYIAYRPGNYELNLNVDGLVGTPSTERYIYSGSRAVVQVPGQEHVPGAGPTVSLSLVRRLN